MPDEPGTDRVAEPATASRRVRLRDVATGWVARLVIAFVGGTTRWRVEDRAGLLEHPPARPVIFAFWHNRYFLMPHLLHKYWRPRRPARCAVLVSTSRDGDISAVVLRPYNIVCVRGSTSRRGQQALLELTRLVQEGSDVAITPDGPRGPRYAVKDGIISLAQLTGTPIVPLSYTLTWKRELKSWDGFLVPFPFGRATLCIAAPIDVPRDADDALRENKRLELESVLKSLSAS